jgi:hypothetical protein
MLFGPVHVRYELDSLEDSDLARNVGKEQRNFEPCYAFVECGGTGRQVDGRMFC